MQTGEKGIPLSREEELVFIRHVHLIAERIQNGNPLKPDGIHFIKTYFPDLYAILSRISEADALEVLEKFKSHPFYRKDIEMVLSPKGKEIASSELKLFRENP